MYGQLYASQYTFGENQAASGSNCCRQDAKNIHFILFTFLKEKKKYKKKLYNLGVIQYDHRPFFTFELRD